MSLQVDAGGVDAVVLADIVDDGPGEGRVVVAGTVGVKVFNLSLLYAYFK